MFIENLKISGTKGPVEKQSASESTNQSVTKTDLSTFPSFTSTSKESQLYEKIEDSSTGEIKFVPAKESLQNSELQQQYDSKCNELAKKNAVLEFTQAENERMQKDLADKDVLLEFACLKSQIPKENFLWSFDLFKTQRGRPEIKKAQAAAEGAKAQEEEEDDRCFNCKSGRNSDPNQQTVCHCPGYCIGENAKVTVVEKVTNNFKIITVADVREGDEVVTSKGTAIVRAAARTYRVNSVRKLPGGLLLTHSHPVKIDGKWQKPGKLAIAEEYHLDTPIWVYNFVLDRCHILIADGYEVVTLGHDLPDKKIQHPYYGTEAVTNWLLSLPVKDGYRTQDAPEI